jgi:hypothetical protein
MSDEPMAASDASIRELLVVTDSEKLINGVYEQLDSMMQGMMQQTLAGHTLTPEQQTIIDDMRARMVAIFKEEMSWSVFEPMMREIYRTTFTEPEVQGMLQFYKSDAGRARCENACCDAGVDAADPATAVDNDAEDPAVAAGYDCAPEGDGRAGLRRLMALLGNSQWATMNDKARCYGADVQRAQLCC